MVVSYTYVVLIQLAIFDVGLRRLPTGVIIDSNVAG